MRYDVPIHFQKVFQGEYNPQTGNYAEDEIEENTCFALVSETQTEMLKLVYGNLRQCSLTVQVQIHICEPFDRIRIGEKLYTVDFIRKLRTKQVLVLSEVQ